MYPGAISFIVYRPASGALDPGDRNTALGRPYRTALEAAIDYYRPRAALTGRSRGGKRDRPGLGHLGRAGKR